MRRSSILLVLCMLSLGASCGPKVDVARLNYASSADILLMTGSPNQPYTELGIIRVRQRWRWQSMEDLLSELRSQARALDADAVIKITYGENLRGYAVYPSGSIDIIQSVKRDEIAGVAVKFIKESGQPVVPMSPQPSSSVSSKSVSPSLPESSPTVQPASSPPTIPSADLDVYIISPKVGDIIEREETVQYGIFQDISGFLWARYLVNRKDGTYWLEYWVTDNQGNKIQKFNRLIKFNIEFVRSKIEQSKNE